MGACYQVPGRAGDVRLRLKRPRFHSHAPPNLKLPAASRGARLRTAAIRELAVDRDAARGRDGVVRALDGVRRAVLARAEGVGVRLARADGLGAAVRDVVVRDRRRRVNARIGRGRPARRAQVLILRQAVVLARRIGGARRDRQAAAWGQSRAGATVSRRPRPGARRSSRSPGSRSPSRTRSVWERSAGVQRASTRKPPTWRFQRPA